MRALLIAMLFFHASVALAQTEPSSPAETAATSQLLEAVVVSGVQPGPGLWRVSKGDKVMWVLGVLSPLPKRMKWAPREVEQIIASSQAFLKGPGVKLKKNIGFFRGLTLLPAALGSRKNPYDKKLVEVVPADLYARWLPLKAKYIGRSSGIEKQRPLFASAKLYEKAIKKNKLTFDSQTETVIKKALKKTKIPLIEPTIEIDLPDPRQAIRDFANSSLDDIDCFAKTLERLETDLQAMRERANAWATGDIEALRALPFTDQNQICADAVLNAGFVKDRGLGDMRARLGEAWLQAAETALATHKSTFAMLPMAQILKPDGYIETLRARGYDVEEP